MSQNELSHDMPVQKKRRPRIVATVLGVTGFLVMLGGGVMLGKTTLMLSVRQVALEAREVAFNQQMTTSLQGVRSDVLSLEKRHSALVTLLEQKDVAQKNDDTLNRQVAPLREDIQQLHTQLDALREQVAHKSVAPALPVAVQTLPAPAVSAPPVAASARKATVRHARTSVASSVTAGHRAPFVLTGIERRGTVAYAAIAPKDYASLSQVQLLGEGEAVSGWTLVSADSDQAQFRVNGRLTTVSVQ